MLERCTGCAFPNGKLVGSRGDPKSPLAVVGEGPGRVEMLKNYPFAGPSGDLLDAGLAQHPDITPYITNAEICFPGTTQTKSLDRIVQATRSCHGRLEHELLAHPREVILALGNAALWSCTGDYGLKITQVRGKVFPTPYARRGVVAAAHPAFLLRGGGSLRQFMADVDYACSLTKGQDFRKYIVPKVEVIKSAAHLSWLAYKLKSLPPGTPVAADTETGGHDGFDHLRDHILCAGFCYDPLCVYVVPEGLISGAAALYDNDCRFVWHNGKFDAKFFRACGVSNVRVDEDTMLLSYALDEVGGQHDLEQVSSDLLGAPDWKYMVKPHLEHAKNVHPKGYKPTYADIPRDVLYDYMAKDISSTLQIFGLLRRRVAANPHLEKLYTKTLIPVSRYLIPIEEAGIKVDLSQVDENRKRLESECAVYEGAINKTAQQYNLAGINPRSPAQLLPFLRDTLKLKLPNGKIPQSTDEDTLLKLPKHAVVISLLKYRKVQKALSTYVNPVPGWINIDGRAHTTYLIHGTVTGRLASRDPNLLNIPRDPFLRGQFVPEPNRIFLEVDINQAELRVLAELSQDKALTKIYTEGGLGIHDVVTLEMYGKISDYDLQRLEFMINKFNLTHIPEVDRLAKLYSEQKMKAKNVNFGIVYGITEVGLADQIDDTPENAAKYLKAWHGKFPEASRFLFKCREAVVLGKNIVTTFGRTKRFGCVSPERLQGLQNEASNFPMQSIASDIMLHTGIRMQPRATSLGIPIVNTVYDSILYECPNDPALLKDIALETMETIPQVAKDWGIRKIPIIGESKTGLRWGSLKDFKVHQ